MSFFSLKKCFSNPNYLIKFIVVIACTCFSVYQVANFIDKLITPPITTYYSFHLNESMSYPSVTICRRPSFKTEHFSKYGLRRSTNLLASNFFRYFHFNRYSIKDFLNETTYGFDEVVGSYAYNGLGANLAAVKWASFETINYGKCFSITPTQNSRTYSISGGFWFYLRHNRQSRTTDSYGVALHGFHIFVHAESDIMTSEYEQDNNFLDYIYLEADEDIRLHLKYQEFNLVHTHENPCVDPKVHPSYSRSKCLEECFHYQIANRTNCTLPWLWLLPNDWLPQCNTSMQLSLLTSSFLNHNRRRLVSNCSCPKSCHVILYTPTIIRRKEIVDDNDQPYSFIAMYYANNLVTQMKENVAYNVNAFVSDIGGSLGFLLGLSVIGLIQVLEKIVCQLIKTYYSKKKKPEEEQAFETQSDVVSNVSDITKVLDDDSLRKYSSAKPDQLNLYENLRDFESPDFKYYQRTLIAESTNRF